MANADDIRSSLLKLRAFVAAMLSDDAGGEIVGFDDNETTQRITQNMK